MTRLSLLPFPSSNLSLPPPPSQEKNRNYTNDNNDGATLSLLFKIVYIVCQGILCPANKTIC